MSELRETRAERGPLFQAVGATLKRQIASGRFAGADVLPGERELSEILRVSRTTPRRAIAGLVAEGVLFHRHRAADAALLDVAEGSAALDIRRIAYLADGRCVECTRSFDRSDACDFVAEPTPSPDARRRGEGPAR